MQQRDGADQPERLTAKEMQEREKQRAIIRQQYLGQQKQKRRIAKASDKFRYAPAPPPVVLHVSTILQVVWLKCACTI